MTPSEIGWSRYKNFEGPFTRGSVPYRMPSNPTKYDKILRVATSTEGGRWNAVNMYDVCILTVGLIQCCEKYYLVSDMLGRIANHDRELLAPIKEMMAQSGVSFSKNGKGRWRFFFGDGRGEVDRPQEQKELFLLNSSGHRGTWDEASKQHSKGWAAAMVNLFAQEATIPIQRDYSVGLKKKFALPFARDYIERAPDTDLGNAFTAAYLSFAGNNPTWANRYLQQGVQSTKADEFTEDWLVDVLRSLTFGPQVHIYPHRYNAIRPVLETLYGIDLPDTSDLLKTDLKEFMPTEEIQQMLVDLGYDLGPYGDNGDGVDGVYTFGGKTYNAIAEFQQLHGIQEDEDDKVGWVGDDTAFALREARRALDKETLDEIGTITEAEKRKAMMLVHLTVQQSLDEYFAARVPA